MKSEGRTVYCGLMKLGVSEAVADRVDRDMVPAHLALRRGIGVVVRKVLDLIQGMNLLAENLCRH